MAATPDKSDIRATRRLREARELKGLTRDQLAAALRVVPDTVGRWERGESRPQARHLRPLAQQLGIDVPDLLKLLEEDDVARGRLGDVISMPGASTSQHHPEDERPSRMQEQVLEAILHGLDVGHATSPSWVTAARAAAHMVGLAWPEDPETLDGGVRR